MAKLKNQTKYICQNCSYQLSKWEGKCPECLQWNTFIEEVVVEKTQVSTSSSEARSLPRPIGEIKFEKKHRVSTGILEFDRALGGGLVPGSLVLVGGEPGIGKSTLLIDACGKLANLNRKTKVLYVSGEESESQIAERSRRLGVSAENLYIYNETSWTRIREQIRKVRPMIFVLDSIQTATSEELQSAPGTVTQIREITYELMNLSKASGMISFVIGHITKEGHIAGPKVLEHMVDTVVYFEGDQTGYYRMLRVMKNRFGDTNEVGLFEMRETGLKEVSNPSEYFLETPIEGAFGRSLCCLFEGSRPLFVEIQALVVENKFGNGRRTTQGIDSNRLAMLIAIIEKYVGLPIGFNDIYVNVVGGLKLDKRDSDLSVMASILSSLKMRPVDEKMVFIGEVGLTGEVRSVSRLESRLKELSQLGYKSVVLSKRAAAKYRKKYSALKFYGIEGAAELENIVFADDVVNAKRSNIRKDLSEYPVEQ